MRCFQSPMAADNIKAPSPLIYIKVDTKTGPEVHRQKGSADQPAEQICRTRAKPQQIVATRLLYCLQYPVPIQVVCKGFTPAHMMVAIRGRTAEAFPPRRPCPPDMVHEPESSISTQLTCAGPTSSFL